MADILNSPNLNPMEVCDWDNIDLCNIYLSEIESVNTDKADVIDLSSTDNRDQPEVKKEQIEIGHESSKPNTDQDITFMPGATEILVNDESSVNLQKEQHVIDGLYNLPRCMIFPQNIEEIFDAQLHGLPVPEAAETITIYGVLSQYLDKMPHGIIDKQIAGVGATTLEIKSKRNSIIVVPTKVLAYNKWIKHKADTLYVGGRINQDKGTTSNKEIQDYIKDSNIPYKKFLVVADSLYRLLRNIGKVNFKDYFLMIDEVDMLQSESNYRPKLESLIDYYFQFPAANRCLVTATLREFTHPLLQQETKFRITWEDTGKRNIKVYCTDNLDALTAQQIQDLPDSEKIVIAFNSIQHCRNIIGLLPVNLQNTCAILCSDSSIQEAGAYYAELTTKNELPKRINFITSCYFAGVDIDDCYHLITVSNANQNYQMLSLNKITQIHGRCRIKNGILSDTIIYNQIDCWKKKGCSNYKDILFKQANAILQLQKTASELSDSDQDLNDLFEIVKTAIRDKGVVSLSNIEPVRLTRTNSAGTEAIAYMNIDYLIEREELRNTIYDKIEHFVEALKKQGHHVYFKQINIPVTDNQRLITESAEKESNQVIDDQLSELIKELRTITQTRYLSLPEKREFQRQKGCSRFINRFYDLQEYADADTLIEQLWKIRHMDARAYKNLRNAVIFWAMDNNHPFKKELLNSFKIGKKYTASEIQKTMLTIVKYHLHKSIKQRASISLLKALFLIERPKIYLIKDLNPIGFKNHGTIHIPSTEDNLLKYFTL